MRQHVNPLSHFFQLPLRLPAPHELFCNPELPIHLDIGSARGQFLLKLAAKKTNWNFLGVEIRRPLVISSEHERNRLELDNLRFLFCNANVSLEEWLHSLPLGILQGVSIQFPDPWFKRRHWKRRVLQPSLLVALAKAMSPGSQFFIQSDLRNVIEPMVSLIEVSGCFARSKKFGDSWLKNNPLGVCTERESYVLEKDLPVYRVLFERNSYLLPELFDYEDETIKSNSIRE